GTSVAAPIVSATAALIKSNYPELRPYDIYNIIMASAKDLRTENPQYHNDLGSGLIDIGSALDLATHYREEAIKILLAPSRNLTPEISIMDTHGNLEDVFLAYNVNFRGGVNLAVGDVNGDGHDEIVTAPRTGGGPHVRIFDKHGKVLSEFFAYVADFYGGVNLAVGDVNGDGYDEIVTAPMGGRDPYIRVFDMHGKVLSEFSAYNSSYTGGVNLALGDVNNDEKDEIITAPRGGHIPEIKIFDYRNFQKDSFLAYDRSMTSGVNISVGDVNNDRWPEIITVPADDNPPQIKLFSMRGRLKAEFLSYSQYLRTGVRVLARDISGDKLPEILSLPSQGTSLLRVYDSLGVEKSNLYLRNPQDNTGYNFEILSW
ncbi:FG-GAP-like repeat-containing protein, partial [bacterium]|nr:FG-GAP-like repeat-containing protein [bacterium]